MSPDLHRPRAEVLTGRVSSLVRPCFFFSAAWFRSVYSINMSCPFVVNDLTHGKPMSATCTLQQMWSLSLKMSPGERSLGLITSKTSYSFLGFLALKIVTIFCIKAELFQPCT